MTTVFLKGNLLSELRVQRYNNLVFLQNFLGNFLSNFIQQAIIVAFYIGFILKISYFCNKYHTTLKL